MSVAHARFRRCCPTDSCRSQALTVSNRPSNVSSDSIQFSRVRAEHGARRLACRLRLTRRMSTVWLERLKRTDRTAGRGKYLRLSGQKRIRSPLVILLILIGSNFFLAACQTTATIPVNNAPGAATTYLDPGTRGPVSGIGVESQDIISMTDRMMRDMLAAPVLTTRPAPPRVIIDAEYFYNESSSRLNKNSITDRLRVNLNRVAQGRMVFVARHLADMVATERALKRGGQVDTGTTSPAKAPQGGDFRLGGRITSLDSRSPTTGQMSRYNQITFEMINLETDEIVWSGIYEFLKTAQDDVIYR